MKKSKAPRAPRPGDGFVQSFARGLAVIRAFSADHPEMTLSEVAEVTQLSRAGARRILLTLAELGYVAAEGRLFRLTPRILDLEVFVSLVPTPLWTHAEPIMEELVEKVHENRARRRCSTTPMSSTCCAFPRTRS